MSSVLPNQPDEPADRQAAQALPPPLPGQAEAADWTPRDWRPPPSAPAKPPLDKVSLIALIAAIPSLGLVSIPLGIWGVIRTKNKQRRGRSQQHRGPNHSHRVAGAGNRVADAVSL